MVHAGVLRQVCAELDVPEVAVEAHDASENLLRLALERRHQRRQLAQLSAAQQQALQRWCQRQAALASDVLSSVGLSPDQLRSRSDFDDDALTELTGVAQLLALGDAHQSSFVCALAELCDRRDRLEKEIIDEQEYQKHLQHLLSSEIVPALSSLDKFKSDLDAREEEDQRRLRLLRAEASTFLPEKLQEYERDLEESLDALQNSGVTTRLSHSELLKLDEQLQHLRRQTRPLREKLRTYNSLPPDILLAKQKLQAARRELESLQAQWQNRLSTFESVFEI